MFFPRSFPNHKSIPEVGPFDYDVVVVGAGPVGALLACLLGSQNIRVLVLEKRSELVRHSMAIGITPPSLQILSGLGLVNEFVHRGIRVRDCFVHGQSGYLGKVEFGHIPSDFPFILSLQQSVTTELLRQKLQEYPSVTVLLDAEVLEVHQQRGNVQVKYTLGKHPGPRVATSRFVVGCDGSRSRVRHSAGICGSGGQYRRHFVMADFLGDSGMNGQAHLFFTAEGSVESFPLPEGQRRWIVQTRTHLAEPPPHLVVDLVRERAGVVLRPEDRLNQSSFTPQWFNLDRYHRGNVALCGDAAHCMSPIGGQGMNTGFADAEFLASALTASIKRGLDAKRLLMAYSYYRRRAAASAISRAAWGMMLGTWRGRPLSMLRDFVISRLLCRGPVARHMGPFYAMLTIPYNRLQRVPITELQPQSR